jgi:fatty acid desaturase
VNKSDFPIPVRLNLCLAAVQLFALPSLLWLAGRVETRIHLAFLTLAYGVAMNSAYALLHEAEHNLLHPNSKVNQTAGTLLALFFPAPFHLIRQGHIGHHMRNRSDDEAFDFYFEGENPLWKYLQLYGILTGFFWVVIFLSNFLALVRPSLVSPKDARFDRPSAAFLESLNPKYQRLIRMEALLVFLLHGSIIYFGGISLARYATVLFGFGFMWSALQYVHHFGTVRHVQKGARNLRTWSWLDLVWLNHNWHLNHHLNPTVPWIYLPSLYSGPEYSRSSLTAAYLKMWRGPRFTTERVQNRYAGKIIK